jgi:Tfp pilus assembly protein PilF
LSEAIRLDPKDPDAWNNLGMVSGEEGKYDDALSQFLEAVRLKPDHVLAVQNALSIYQYQGNATAARRLLDDAVRRSPENADLRLGLGTFLMEQNELRPALEQLEACARIAPDDDRAWINIAMIYKAGGDSEKGRQVLRKYLGRHPDDGVVRGALQQLGEK